jgi:hypothetical protein
MTDAVPGAVSEASIPLDPPHTGDVVGRDVLTERCQSLEQALRARNIVSADDVDKARPGGAHNPDPSALGWLAYFAQLHRWHATDMAAHPPAGAAGRWDARAMDDMRAALAAEPRQLTLDSGRQVAVYPKGEHALNRLAVIGLACEWVTVRRLALMDEDQTPDTLAALRAAVDAEAQLTAEFLAILTHPGPGVPWAEESRWEQETPAWCRDDVSPFDVIAMRRAHLDVNLLRVNAIAERTRHLSAGGSEAMPLAAFLGVMAAELHVRPEDLARRWTLGEVFASALARWEAQERGKAKAEAERDRGPR